MSSSPSLHAAEPDWPRTSYDYVVIDQDLRVVLEQFGVNTGLRVVLSDAVEGKVHGRLPAAEPRAFLQRLTQMFGLDWYYDGAAIAVSAASEAQSRVLTLRNVTFETLHDALASADLLDPRYQLRQGPAANIAIASGPPRYLAAVQQTATALSAEKNPAQAVSSASEQGTLMVYRGAAASKVEFHE
jgi:type III secretion protein C